MIEIQQQNDVNLLTFFIRLHQSLQVNLFIFHSSQMLAKDVSDFFSPSHSDAWPFQDS